MGGEKGDKAKTCVGITIGAFRNMHSIATVRGLYFEALYC